MVRELYSICCILSSLGVRGITPCFENFVDLVCLSDLQLYLVCFDLFRLFESSEYCWFRLIWDFSSFFTPRFGFRYHEFNLFVDISPQFYIRVMKISFSSFSRRDYIFAPWFLSGVYFSINVSACYYHYGSKRWFSSIY